MLESQLYANPRCDDIDAAWSMAASVAVDTALFALFGCVFAGWSTYRPCIPLTDIACSFATSFSFFGAMALSNFIPQFAHLSRLSLFSAAIALALLYRRMQRFLSELTDLLHIFQMRIMIVFLLITFSLVVAIGLVNQAGLALGIGILGRMIVVEGGCLALFWMQMGFLMARSESVAAKRLRKKFAVSARLVVMRSPVAVGPCFVGAC
jgi:hypothetical protein